MNKKTRRLLNAIACTCASYNVSDTFVRELHKVVIDSRDGYPFDFIAEVNSFRNLFGKHYSIEYPQKENQNETH